MGTKMHPDKLQTWHHLPSHLLRNSHLILPKKKKKEWKSFQNVLWGTSFFFTHKITVTFSFLQKNCSRWIKNHVKFTHNQVHLTLIPRGRLGRSPDPHSPVCASTHGSHKGLWQSHPWWTMSKNPKEKKVVNGR